MPIQKDEFAFMRGESQVPGQKALALPRELPPSVPFGPAPPNIRQVQSVYDSRPIGAYDFVLTDIVDPYAEPPEALITTPEGYITILRRVELEANPVMVVTAGGGIMNQWVLRVNGITVPNWQWDFEPLLTFRAIDTFIVVPPNTTISIFSPLGTPLTGTPTTLFGRFIGNLILDSNESPNQLVGSNPHSVIVTKGA